MDGKRIRDAVGSIVAFPNRHDTIQIGLAHSALSSAISTPEFKNCDKIDLLFYRDETRPLAITVFGNGEYNGVKVVGPIRQEFNLENPDLALTFIHEFAHLLDYWCFQNPYFARGYSSHTRPQFEDWRRAVCKTESYRRLRDSIELAGVSRYGDASSSKSILLAKNSLTKKVNKESQKELADLFTVHEFFARNLVDYVCRLESTNPKLKARYYHELGSERNALWGRYMHDDDFSIVIEPFRTVLKHLDAI